MPHQSGHLGYIRGHVVDLGHVLPSLFFHISKPDGEFICMAWGLKFEGSILAYDPTTNRAEWIPVWGSAGDLLLAEEASAQELSNIVLHDPSEVLQRVDRFGEQMDESSTQEAMELDYQPSSEGDVCSNSSDGLHSPRHAAQHSLRHRRQSSISWADQCPSNSKDQHMPGGARDASHKTTDESEGEEQLTQPASP